LLNIGWQLARALTLINLLTFVIFEVFYHGFILWCGALNVNHLVLELGFTRSQPTVYVSGMWAGVDSLWEQKKLEARKMLENAARAQRSPTSSVCTLCWHAFELQDTLAFTSGHNLVVRLLPPSTLLLL
jgi:hypothetical protein